MTFIQTVVLLVLFKAVFSGAFSAWYFAIGDLFIEITVFLFLVIGSLNRFKGVTPETVEIHYRQYQLYMIYLILITTVVLLIQIIIKFVSTALEHIRVFRMNSKLSKAANQSKKEDIEESKSMLI